MPAANFKTYAKVLFISAVSMMAGSQVIHQHFKPLEDLEEYVQREIQKRKEKRA